MLINDSSLRRLLRQQRPAVIGNANARLTSASCLVSLSAVFLSAGLAMTQQLPQAQIYSPQAVRYGSELKVRPHGIPAAKLGLVSRHSDPTSQVTETPAISPDGGIYAGSQTVTITDNTPGAVIYYSINGQIPGTYSNIYNGPITLSGSATVAAVAMAPGYADSQYAVANFYIGNNNGVIYSVAGSSLSGYAGDGGPATQAQFSAMIPAMDKSGDLYLADPWNYRVRKVDAATGTVTTIAGNGTPGDSGDGRLATDAELFYPHSLAVDSKGNVYVADSDRVRRIDAQTGIITTVAGGGAQSCNSSCAAQQVMIGPQAIAIDNSDVLFIAESSRVWKYTSADSRIALVAGSGWWGYCGDNLPAVSACFDFLTAIAVDQSGNVFVADAYNHLILRIDASSGVLTRYAGNGKLLNTPTFYDISSGDGGPALDAQLTGPSGLAVDSGGNLYISDQRDGSLRRVDAVTKFITRVAGQIVGWSGVAEDGGPAGSALLGYPLGVAVDSNDAVYIGNSGWMPLRKVVFPATPPTKVAPAPQFSLAGGSYSAAQEVSISSTIPGATIRVTMDSRTPMGAWPVYMGPIEVTGDVTIKAYAVAPGYAPSDVASSTYTLSSLPDSVILTVATDDGTLSSGGTPLQYPLGLVPDVATDSAGNLYLASASSNTILKMASGTGKLTVIAGTGTAGYSGDGGLATSAQLNQPRSIALDKVGNLYVADYANNVIRRIDASTGTISTVVGNGTQGSSGDGGPATQAEIGYPAAVRLDSGGNLYLTDSCGVIRKVDSITGTISTLGGKPDAYTDSGDGGPVSAATFSCIQMLAMGSNDDLYISSGGSKIRKIAHDSGIITTVAGNGTGYSGDGEAALDVPIVVTGAFAVDPAGNIVIPNSCGIRRVDATTGIISTIAGNRYCGYSGDGTSATVAQVSTEALAFDRTGQLFMSDGADSVIRKIKFTHSDVQTALPTVSLAPGSYIGKQTVTLSDSTPGAIIYYTVDGTEPTLNSPVYANPLAVAVSTTVKAMAIAPGFFDSDTESAAYTILDAQTITFDLPVSAATYGDGPISLTATATSGLPVTFSVLSGPGSISGNVLTITGGGTIVIAADQAGNDIYGAATQVQRSLKVSLAAPSVSWANPPAIIYGTALGSKQLNATASVGGTFDYSPAEGTVLAAGTHTLTVVFTPTDSANYSSANAQVTLVVDQAVPALTWPTPAAITYGTQLTNLQLNATASVSGTFAYSPAAGTVLSVGAQTLSATFTPTDTVDYTNATATVTLQVSNPVPVISTLDPAFANAGAAGFTVTVKGSGFAPASVISWAGQSLTTNFVSTTELTTQISASQIATAGAIAVLVSTPTPGGGTSNVLQFQVNTGSGNGAPTISSTSVTVTAGSSASVPVSVPAGTTINSMSCLNAPAGTTCTYSAGTITITTSVSTPKGTYQITVVFSETLPASSTLSSRFAFLVPPLLLAGFFRRSRRLIRAGMILMVALAVAFSVSGCGASAKKTVVGSSSATVTLNVK